MTIVGKTEDGLTELYGAVSIEINQEQGVPCDDLTVVFAYNDNFPILSRIYLLDDSCEDIEEAVLGREVLFSGIVDEQVLTADTDGAEIKVYARSFAALLTDNECIPQSYSNPTDDVIYHRHLAQFGLYTKPNNTSVRSGEMRIYKGESHYKAVERYCKQFYGGKPRIDCTGTCHFDGMESDECVVFDNCNGVPFDFVSVSEKNYSRISQVKVSLNGVNYDTCINDTDAEKRGVIRQRYLDISDGTGNSMSDAERMIKSGKSGSFSVVLKCDAVLINKLGAKAEINIPQCESKKMLIKELHCKITGSGAETTVKVSAV